ncbi:MAG: hypothetical protein WCC08_08650 [Terrimicrobiaceae bacterium]
MKARSLILSMVAIVGAFLFATPAEAGDCRRKRHHHGYNRGGWNDYGYYQPRRYYRPRYVRYYQPRYYAPPPFFQIGFAFGGNRNCR